MDVWAGVIDNHIIKPKFIEGNITSHTYLQFIEEELEQQELLEDLSEEEREEMYFRQDGRPAHGTNSVFDALSMMFPNRWIALRGPCGWPLRSPDLTFCDCFLWGYLK